MQSTLLLNSSKILAKMENDRTFTLPFENEMDNPSSKQLGRTQCRELPLCAGSGEGCLWQALPSPVQCEETATRTQDLPVTGGKTLPVAPGLPF